MHATELLLGTVTEGTAGMTLESDVVASMTRKRTASTDAEIVGQIAREALIHILATAMIIGEVLKAIDLVTMIVRNSEKTDIDECE